ncbi:MAG: bis(5'-nucleosyl)-tetraphosphatase (symmetrical) YqeK [Treponema sp.]|nr:bis(5'-nucleosyl)-tetraphosphatase (symmetrical) YqeK [Treponema sp.]
MSFTGDILNKVREYAKSAEKPERYEHSVRVAETARKMCDIYGEDPDKGYFTGLAHDICKDLDDDTQISLAQEDGQEITELERKKPFLLHGRAAAIKLQKDFGVNDPDVIQAVANHTFGGIGFCKLAKIIFAADKIEPGRPQSTEEYRRELFSKPLDQMALAVLQMQIDFLVSRGKEVAPVSYIFKDSLMGGDGQ